MPETQLAKDGSLNLSGATLSPVGIEFDQSVTADQWEAVGQVLERADGAIQWWIGDWLRFGEGRPEWGDKYKQAITMFGRDYKTLSEYKTVAATFKFPERSGNLNWSHYQAIAYQPPDVRAELLNAAEPDEPNEPPRMSVSEIKKEAKRRRCERETPALPVGKYRVIYADPPWEYDDENRAGSLSSGAVKDQYNTLSTEAICALHKDGRSICDLRDAPSVLFLWATSPMQPEAYRVMASWGFSYKAQFMWDKGRPYMGSYNAVQHEVLMLGVHGSCTPVDGVRPSSVMRIPRTEHSRKPDEFYELIESMYPGGPHLELFARRERDGWESWGNEV